MPRGNKTTLYAGIRPAGIAEVQKYRTMETELINVERHTRSKI